MCRRPAADPDGETGDRNNWIFFQLQRFLEQPWLVPEGPLDAVVEGDYENMPSCGWPRASIRRR